MNNFLLFQINMTPDEVNVVNREGWEFAKMMFPRVKAYLANSISFSREERVTDLDLYDLTARIKAENLDEVFEVTNLWNRPEQVKKFRQAVRSGSVGDIIADVANDRFYMIASCGFDDITDEIEAA